MTFPMATKSSVTSLILACILFFGFNLAPQQVLAQAAGDQLTLNSVTIGAPAAGSTIALGTAVILKATTAPVSLQEIGRAHV